MLQMFEFFFFPVQVHSHVLILGLSRAVVGSMVLHFLKLRQQL